MRKIAVRKNSASQSGIFNPRALLAFGLCSISALLAMLSFAASAPSVPKGANTKGSFRAISQPPASFDRYARTPSPLGLSAQGLFPRAGVGPNSPNRPSLVHPQVGRSSIHPRQAPSTLLAPAEPSDWSIVSSPNGIGSQRNFLFDTTCISESDCWAVGVYFTNTTGVYQTLIEHWDGTSWAIVASPNTSPAKNNVLNAVTCVSASDCWAVGYYSSNDGADRTLIQRWNGSSWSVVSSPNAPGYSFLYSVVCTSASNCWAVGNSYNGTNNRTFIERWNGNSWAVVTSPNTSANLDNYLSDVTCVSSSNCWAVGYSTISTPDGDRSQTLVERWNGTAWSIVASPNMFPMLRNNYLYGVTCASASDCWAVGFYYDASGLFLQTLIEHWNGTSWALAVSPNSSPEQDNVLESVTCASASECWAAGYYLGGSDNIGSVDQTLVQRWDGTSWTIVASPNTSSAEGNFFLGVTCVPGSDCWAVGSYYINSGNTFLYQTLYQTLIERWDGNAWSIVNSPNTVPAETRNTLSGVTCTSPSDCWAVGDFHPGESALQTLIERWNGTSLSLINSPNTSRSQDNSLADVTCTSTSGCWAVG